MRATNRVLNLKENQNIYEKERHRTSRNPGKRRARAPTLEGKSCLRRVPKRAMKKC